MSGGQIMMGLGDYRFEIGTAAYQQLARWQEFRWQQQDRIGRHPAMQYTGPGLITVDLAGVIYPAFRGGLGQCAAMRDSAARGEPLDLVDGSGKVWGAYVINDVSETETTFFADGQPRKIEFTLMLTQYGEDEAAGAAYAGSGFGEAG